MGPGVRRGDGVGVETTLRDPRSSARSYVHRIPRRNRDDRVSPLCGRDGRINKAVSSKR
jgi:hypothetical protein